MNNSKIPLRIVTITLFLLTCFASHVYAFDLDLTVDDEIRKNYNPSQLVKDTDTEDLEPLPDLPENLQTEIHTKDVQKAVNKSINIPLKNIGNTKITKGTSFNVVNTSKISDWQKKGTIVKFKTTVPIYKRRYTIPASTIFMGEITESHQPQISCNGGLVVIRIKSFIYKGQTVPLNAYVTRANDKMIFLNNIKGERTYLKTMWKKGNWGRSLFGRMLTLTVNLGSEGSTFLLSPFPLVYGTLCFGANTLLSPFTAFFKKGGHVSINSGSQFKIRLLEDTYID